MGEAKRRGPLEIRIRESQEAEAKRATERRRAIALADAALSPEERELRKAKRHQARMFLTLAAGLTAGMGLDGRPRRSK